MSTGSSSSGSPLGLGPLPSGTQADQTPQTSEPAPAVDGDSLPAAATTDGTGSNTAVASLEAEDTRSGLIRPREGDDELAPEPKKLKTDTSDTL
jgi:hypothetical protein